MAEPTALVALNPRIGLLLRSGNVRRLVYDKILVSRA